MSFDGCRIADGGTANLVPVNTGVVKPKPLTITAQPNTKVYDSTKSAAATPLATGLVGTDTITATEMYDNHNVGTGKTLSVSPGYTVNDGNLGLNYCSTDIFNANNGCVVGDGGRSSWSPTLPA